MINAGTVITKVNTFLSLVDKLSWEEYTDGYTGDKMAPSTEQKDAIKAQAQAAYAEAQQALQEMAGKVSL